MDSHGSRADSEDFQQLRATLKKQQEGVSSSLKNLGLQDATESNKTNRSREENTCEGASANLGNLKHLLVVFPIVGVRSDIEAFKPVLNVNEVDAIFNVPLQMFLKVKVNVFVFPSC